MFAWRRWHLHAPHVEGTPREFADRTEVDPRVRVPISSHRIDTPHIPGFNNGVRNSSTGSLTPDKSCRFCYIDRSIDPPSFLYSFLSFVNWPIRSPDEKKAASFFQSFHSLRSIDVWLIIAALSMSIPQMGDARIASSQGQDLWNEIRDWCFRENRHHEDSD